RPSARWGRTARRGTREPGSGSRSRASSSSSTGAGSGSRARWARARSSRSPCRCRRRGTGGTDSMARELLLIVEDNEKNRKLVRDVLQYKGYRTQESETAEEGIRLAHESRPALILMDIQLP